jgi:hypothetical protein
MCLSITYDQYHNAVVTHYDDVFPRLLPYVQFGQLHYTHWGSHPEEKTDFPLGGWIGKSKQFNSIWTTSRVLIPATQFTVMDRLNNLHIFQVQSGDLLYGQLFTVNDSTRLYIEVSDHPESPFSRWPVINKKR